jgi:hypothetical protein
MLSDMRTTDKLQPIDKKIARVKQALSALGPMHPGSLSRQYHVCGKPGCKCHASPRPAPHGPYCKLNYVYHGKFACRFVRETSVAEVTALVATFKRFKQLMDQWVALSIERAQLGPLARRTAKTKARPPAITSAQD